MWFLSAGRQDDTTTFHYQYMTSFHIFPSSNFAPLKKLHTDWVKYFRIGGGYSPRQRFWRMRTAAISELFL
jgi:hypothetical protein